MTIALKTELIQTLCILRVFGYICEGVIGTRIRSEEEEDLFLDYRIFVIPDLSFAYKFGWDLDIFMRELSILRKVMTEQLF